MQDRCFLCPEEVGEAAPRQFWTGPNGILMLAHTHCLDKFRAGGEVWPPPEPEQPPSRPGSTTSGTSGG